MQRFIIIVPSFNCVDYIEKCLKSIESQQYSNYQVCAIDDASTIPKQRDIILKYCTRNNWTCRFHEQNMGALHGVVHVLHAMECDDDTVIVMVDGDDWLAHEHVLEKLDTVYEGKDTLLTWGQCAIFPPGKTEMKYSQPISQTVIQDKLYREIPFVFRHLTTFKYALWKRIKDEDLRDENGEYYRILKDKAIMFPMLEMAGDRIAYIPEVLYIYNLENPINDYLTNHDDYLRVNAILKNKPKYETLENA